MAVISILMGDFGEFQMKVLVTTFSISAASICSMSCAAFVEKKNDWGIQGILVSALAAVLVIAGVWGEIDGEAYWKLTVSCIVFAVASAHLFLLFLPNLDSKHQWSQRASGFFISVLAVMIAAAVWGEIDDAFYYKLLSVVSVIVVLLTLIIPVLMKIQKEVPGKVKTLILSERPDGTFVDKSGAVYNVTQLSEGESERITHEIKHP